MTINLGIYQDGTIGEAAQRQMSALRQAIRGSSRESLSTLKGRSLLRVPERDMEVQVLGIPGIYQDW